MQSKIDFTSDIMDQIPSESNDLKQAVKYANEMLDIEAEIFTLGEQIKKLLERHDQIQLTLLPDLMLQCGMSKFSLESGYEIKCKKFIRGAIPTLNQIEQADDLDKPALLKRRTEAIAWLRKVGADSIIKNQVVALFGKGQDAHAQSLYEDMKAKGFVVKKEEEINFQTLNSYLKGELEKGHEVPAEPFALFVGSKAEMKKLKKKD